MPIYTVFPLFDGKKVRAMAIAIDAIDYVERLMSIQTMLKAWKPKRDLKP